MKRSLVPLTAVLLILIAGNAWAEDSSSDVSANITGVYTNQPSGEGLTQKATNSAGLLLSYRYFFNRYSGIETNFGYTKNSQVYADQFGNLLAEIQTGMYEVTGAYVLRAGGRRAPVRPFALVGGGLLIFTPTNIATLTSLIPVASQNRPTFLYGAGVDIKVNREVAVRAQYRGLLYEAPDFQQPFALHSGAAMHTAEPSAGLVFRF